MTTGDQAQVWANDYIKVHLSKMPTYRRGERPGPGKPHQHCGRPG